MCVCVCIEHRCRHGGDVHGVCVWGWSSTNVDMEVTCIGWSSSDVDIKVTYSTGVCVLWVCACVDIKLTYICVHLCLME